MSSLSNSFHLPLHIHTSPPSPLQSSWLPGRLICMDYISGISCCRSSAWFLPKEIQAGDLLKVEKQDQYICSPASLPAGSSLSSCYPKLKVIAPLLEISPPNSPSGFHLCSLLRVLINFPQCYWTSHCDFQTLYPSLIRASSLDSASNMSL